MAVVQKGEVVNASIQTSGLPNPKPAIGLQIMHNGVSKAYYDIKLDDGGKATVEIPSDQLPTGVNQFTTVRRERTCVRRPPDIRQPSRI